MTAESQELREERIYRHLQAVDAHVRADLASTSDPTLRRIEMDAATIITLELVKDLLPGQLRTQVQQMIDLHEEVWQSDLPPRDGTTPRKPPGEDLIERLAALTRSSEPHL